MNTGDLLFKIQGWGEGIAGSPHVGTALLQNVEIDSFTGAIRPTKNPTSVFPDALSKTFTAEASTDVCTIPSGELPPTGTAVTVSTTGTLPAGLSAATNYFIIKVSSTTFKLATTITNADASTAIDITDAGTGTHTVTSVDPGDIKHYAYDRWGDELFAIDDNGRVWYQMDTTSGDARLLNGNTLTNSAGNGLAVFRTSDGSATYLFAFRNATIDVVAVTGTAQKGAPSWTNGWQSLNSGAGSGNSHHAIVGQDNIIYFTDDRYVGSILETPGDVFDPSDSNSYTFNNQALDLPLGAVTYWLSELGADLLISVSNDDKVYPWNRTADSYGLPLPVGEYNIGKMKNIGNTVFIQAGTRGHLYKTQGTYVEPYVTIPEHLIYDTIATPIANKMTWGGMESDNGNLLVGVSAGSGKSGVYRINQDGAISLDNYPSTGQANVLALFATDEFYYMGYANGADTMDTDRRGSLGADVDNPIVVLQSELRRVGNNKGKATISMAEAVIAEGVTGSIRLSYRTGLSDNFTAITTWTTDTSNTTYAYDAGLTDLENIQFQVELAGDMDFMELRLYK